MTLVTTRQPTLRCVVPDSIEDGARAIICWNGSRAGQNGVPGWTNPIDYDNPLDGPLLLDGGDSAENGWGAGGWGEGGWGSPNFYFDYGFSFPLRDGDYAASIILVDKYGNRQAGPGPAVSFRVIAPVRAPGNLRSTDYDAGTGVLTVAFAGSEEFVP